MAGASFAPVPAEGTFNVLPDWWWDWDLVTPLGSAYSLPGPKSWKNAWHSPFTNSYHEICPFPETIPMLRTIPLTASPPLLFFLIQALDTKQEKKNERVLKSFEKINPKPQYNVSNVIKPTQNLETTMSNGHLNPDDFCICAIYYLLDSTNLGYLQDGAILIKYYLWSIERCIN